MLKTLHALVTGLREIRLESLAASFLLARRFYCNLRGKKAVTTLTQL